MSVAQEKFSYAVSEEKLYEKRKTRRELSKRALRRGKVLVTCCILAMFATGVAIAYYYSQVSTLGYQISQLQKDLSKLQAEQEYLESQANQLMSLQRIEAIATTKLGMVKPNSDEVVLVAALPKELKQKAKEETNLEKPQLSQESTASEKDNLEKTVAAKSPVIEAFVDLVKGWEK
ncbi:cell division protein FtsL [Desulforamulus reducens MI-1]|uniref:Cell division protein FtsL n=1 Tax=Desulforamulus reducens (strain ATCC BAA-1160 / DSM 100696 / MI-1) TaxID=349161 RepID=A4J2A4_DESRM|nr:cell division protein FtsL [Desulforamulus reducens]ABO49207.1 cell division protein FtsL [Desulforamulus reducens MI-1]